MLKCKWEGGVLYFFSSRSFSLCFQYRNTNLVLRARENQIKNLLLDVGSKFKWSISRHMVGGGGYDPGDGYICVVLPAFRDYLESSSSS